MLHLPNALIMLLLEARCFEAKRRYLISMPRLVHGRTEHGTLALIVGLKVITITA